MTSWNTKTMEASERARAIARTYETTVEEAAKEFNVPLSTLSTWRTKAAGRATNKRSKATTLLTQPKPIADRQSTKSEVAIAIDLLKTALNILERA